MRHSRVPQGLTRLGLSVAAGSIIFFFAWRLTPASTRLVTAVIVGSALLVFLCVLVLPAQLVARDTTVAALEPEQRASAIGSARTILVQGMVGLAAPAGIFVAWQQLQDDHTQASADREQLREQLVLTRQGQVADRFTRAVDQLASSKAEQRLGGIYGLEQIARESSNDDVRLVVIELLRTYVRQNATRPVRVSSKNFPSSEGKGPAPDLQAAMTVLEGGLSWRQTRRSTYAA